MDNALKPKVTPKDFFFWAGAMLALYWSVVAFLFLTFDYLNYALPSATDYLSDPYQSGIPYEMASLVILPLVFLALMRLIRRDIARDSSRNEIWVRRWALMLTLFVAGVAMAGDLVVLLSTFFSGDDLTGRFLLKVVLVLLVAAAVFMHFIADLRGYWAQYPGRAARVGWGVGVLVLVTLVAGFFIVGTPWQAREYRLDAERVSDLQQLQSEIINYWQAKQALPSTLADLNDSLSYQQTPVDPQTNQPFDYTATSGNSFQLCADFAAPSNANYSEPDYSQPVAPTAPGGTSAMADQNNWQHAMGHICFSRTIDPVLYPPLRQ